MRRLCLFICFVFVCLSVATRANAQAVSATIVDTQGQTWAYAVVSFTLNNPSGQRPINTQTGLPVTIPPPITANSTGFFTTSLTANNIIVPFGTQWIPHICPFNPNMQCQTLAAFTLSIPVDISASIATQLNPVTIGDPFLFPLSHSGTTGRSSLNGSAYYDVQQSGLYVRNPATGGYSEIGSIINGSPVCTQAAPCATGGNVPLSSILNPTANTLFDLTSFSLTTQGTAPAATAASGAASGGYIDLVSGNGQGTTGTTGQTGGAAAVINIGGGNGGAAPAGSTNGIGGDVYINGGPAGAGAGTAARRGAVIIGNAANSTTYIGVGVLANQGFQVANNGAGGFTAQLNGSNLCTSTTQCPAVSLGNSPFNAPARMVVGNSALVAGTFTVTFSTAFSGQPFATISIINGTGPGATTPTVWVESLTPTTLQVASSSTTATNAVFWMVVGPP
jgi:hypothetical protein